MYRADSAGQDFPGRMLGKCLVQLFHYNAGLRDEGVADTPYQDREW